MTVALDVVDTTRVPEVGPSTIRCRRAIRNSDVTSRERRRWPSNGSTSSKFQCSASNHPPPNSTSLSASGICRNSPHLAVHIVLAELTLASVELSAIFLSTTITHRYQLAWRHPSITPSPQSRISENLSLSQISIHLVEI